MYVKCNSTSEFVINSNRKQKKKQKILKKICINRGQSSDEFSLQATYVINNKNVENLCDHYLDDIDSVSSTC